MAANGVGIDVDFCVVVSVDQQPLGKDRRRTPQQKNGRRQEDYGQERSDGKTSLWLFRIPQLSR